MQKVINGLALLSFIGTASIIGGGTYVYLQRVAIIEGIKSQVTEHATEAITGALPGMLDSAMPELPNLTGGALPAAPGAIGGGAPAIGGASAITGPAIPSF